MNENIINFATAPRQPSGRGKIARLPHDIREQLNQRLLNGQRASLILPWLNSLPPVIEILTTQFDGEPVSAQNLSNWRIAGYQHWLRHQQDFDKIKQFGEFAAGLSSARRDHIAVGAATVATVRIFESLKATMDTPLSFADMGKVVHAVIPLLYAQESQARLKILKKKVNLEDNQRRLLRGKLHPNDIESHLIKVNHA